MIIVSNAAGSDRGVCFPIGIMLPIGTEDRIFIIITVSRQDEAGVREKVDLLVEGWDQLGHVLNETIYKH